MAGPARFVNHSCEPNAIYVASSYHEKSCVRVQLTRSVHPGEEILVYYASDCFGDGNVDCKCPHQLKHQGLAESQSIDDENHPMLLTLPTPRLRVRRRIRNMPTVTTYRQRKIPK